MTMKSQRRCLERIIFKYGTSTIRNGRSRNDGPELSSQCREHGFSGIGYNKHRDKLDLLLQESEGLPLTGVDNVPDFIAGLETPRRIMMLVPRVTQSTPSSGIFSRISIRVTS
jgi:hypothetical protein